MHLLFNNLRYSPSASSNVNYFLVLLADVKCGLYGINKNNRANATHGPKYKKCSKTKPKRCWNREVRHRDLDLYGHYVCPCGIVYLKFVKPYLRNC